MKPNKLQQEICDTVVILTKVEHINQFVIENKISKEDTEELTNALNELYYTIKTIGLLNNNEQLND